MVSTFLSYRMYTADYAKSVQRTLSDASVAREQTYYRENIGKLTSVDDFLDDQRLYAYAMKANGLEDMIYAKAFMRKVLESDLSSDPARERSFVEKLVDQRYLAFARTFNFTPEGGVDEGVKVVQDSSDMTETVGLYSEQRMRKGAAVAAEVDYYKARMATITSVDQLVSDPRLFSFALTSYGIDASIASEVAIKEVLTSDLSDPNSVANRFNDSRYTALAAAFSFEADGSVAPGGQAQTAAQLTQTIDRNYEATGSGASPAAAAFKTGVFGSLIGGITSVDDFVANDMLRDYALVAVGLDPILVSDDMVRAALVSDLDDPGSAANTLGEKYRQLASMFNFSADGTTDPGQPAQTAEQQDTLTDLYFANYQAKSIATEQSSTDTYKLAMSFISTVDDLVNDPRVFKYVLEAYGLDPTEESVSKIRQVLTSDPSDPLSFVGRLRDERYTALARAFNFDAKGEAQGPLRAQFASSKSETVSLYSSKQGTYDYQIAAGKIESEYYFATIDSVETVDQLLDDDRLVTYLKKAYGFGDEAISDQVLRLVLTSDRNDPRSFVNSGTNTRFRELADAFNFGTDGLAKRVSVGQAQDENDILDTQDLYLRQTIEQRAGDQNQGVRLALYFQRKAPSITSAFGILADKALMEVAMTALGFPDSMAQADTDRLAKMIESRIDFADFKDPAKVDKFLARFTALYDIGNPQTTTSIPSLLLGGQDGGIIGLDLLASIQSIKLTL